MTICHISYPGAFHCCNYPTASVSSSNIVNLCHEGQKLTHGHFWVERRSFWQISCATLGFNRLIKNVEASDNHFTLRWWYVPRQDAHCRCLASAVRTKESEDFTMCDTKTYVVDSSDGAVCFTKMPNLDHQNLLVCYNIKSLNEDEDHSSEIQ